MMFQLCWCCHSLVDYAIITKVDKSQVIGPQKPGDERRRYREKRREAELGNLKEFTSFYFDGKKTMTRVLVKNNKTERWSPTIKVDDHYVVLTEPGNDYLTHVTRKIGHGKVVARAIYDFLVEHELTNQPLYVAGCDEAIPDQTEVLSITWRCCSPGLCIAASVSSTVMSSHSGQYYTITMANPAVRRTGEE